MNDLIGTWTLRLHNESGAAEATLTVLVGEAMTARLRSPTANADFPLVNVDSTGFRASGKAAGPMPVTITLTGRVEDDVLTGSMQVGVFGSAEFTGHRERLA